MSKRKKNKKVEKKAGLSIQSKAQSATLGTKEPTFSSKKVIYWTLGTIATLALGSLWGFLSGYFTEDVKLVFVKPEGRGYEFKLVNNIPSDQIIESFRVRPMLGEEFSFLVTKDIAVADHEDGIEIPGGSNLYIPAFEYRDLDQKEISGKSELNFKIPPLLSRDYLSPDLMKTSISYKTRSKNSLLSLVEKILQIRSKETEIKYLISENYWGIDSSLSSMEILCRDNDLLAKSSHCENEAASKK